MENPIFCKTVSAKSVKVGERYLRNHNKLLWQVEGADGVKTVYTKAAGRILVSSAVRKGRRLICVTIDDPNDWADHAKLLEDGSYIYFVHSFDAENCEDSLAATTDYGIPITAAVEKDNIFGCQFHPEKSGKVGLAILRAFCEMEGN